MRPRARQSHPPPLAGKQPVKGGDTLPLMCYDIYGASGYYLEVARINGLTAFRDLAIGSQVVFPPLAEGAAES